MAETSFLVKQQRVCRMMGDALPSSFSRLFFPPLRVPGSRVEV